LKLGILLSFYFPLPEIRVFDRVFRNKSLPHIKLISSSGY
jgi:hypothetical protein